MRRPQRPFVLVAIPAVVVVMVIARIVGVIAMMVTVVVMMVAVVAMMVVVMMIAIPRRGWDRAAGRDCANNAQCRSSFP